MVFLIIHEYSLGTMFQNQNLQITFLVLHLFDPKKMIFFIREQKILQENLKFRVLVMFSRKNEFFTNLAILIGCRLFN